MNRSTNRQQSLNTSFVFDCEPNLNYSPELMIQDAFAQIVPLRYFQSPSPVLTLTAFSGQKILKCSVVLYFEYQALHRRYKKPARVVFYGYKPQSAAKQNAEYEK